MHMHTKKGVCLKPTGVIYMEHTIIRDRVANKRYRNFTY